ncbi:MAG: AAA family ATPase [Chloroflexota bacterium]|nr:AAA family ATPase [Chloroflexota bacterium]
MICPSCGTDNPTDKRFCGDCGWPLASGCPACGATNPPSKRFCGDCGIALIAASAAGSVQPPNSVSEPVAERRLVSVLFADLVGFTTLAEGRDAEDTRELLARYFDLARQVIGRYGGTVEKFIGDAVMAVWGAPIAHEDDAERAVRAALELVDAVKRVGPGIAARAGVLTGEAAVTIGARNESMVAGDLVNTAARLQSVAEPGTVLVGESTMRATSAAITFEAAGEQTLKGKAAPVQGWRALRIVAEVGGRNRSASLEAPFVGRDDELRLIKDLFHATTREQRSRLVSVMGPAGIGKSRLAWEFSKYADGLVESVWFHDGRCPAYGDGISFWALGEMIRGRAGLLETDDEPTTRTKVAATVAEHVPDEVERRWIEPALLALLGIDTDAVGSDQLFGAWRTFFERLAATAPVVLVFEDFHHADSGLIDFVDRLLEWSKALPIYVVTLARPELLERRPDWGAAKRSFTSLFLEPLAPAAMRELLVGLVPGLPDGAVRAIVARADGIPLYAVETVRMLLAEGKLKLEGDLYRPAGDLTDLAVPETLIALIASRLDALPANDRAIVSDAAVLGQSFTLAGLAAVSGRSEKDLETLLRSLIRRELLTLETDTRSPERGQYAFVQALIREVAYNTLAKRDRKARHLAAARFFESLDTEEIAGGLAGHYLAAHRNSPEGPEADAVAVQARIALRSAAQRASLLGSLDQALRFLTQALTVVSDRADEAELLELAGEAAAAAGRHDEAESLLRSAIEVDRARGDRVGAARATAALGRELLHARHGDVALGLLEAASAEFADLGAEPAVAALGGQLARAYFLNSDNRRAIDVSDLVLESAEHGDLVEILADVLITKGSALDSIGRTVEGAALLRAAQDIAEARGLTETMLRAIGNRLGNQILADPKSVLEIGRAGIVVARRSGRRSQLAFIIQNSSWAAQFVGEWDWAVGELETMLSDELETSDRAETIDALVSFRAYRGESVEDLMTEIEHLLGDATDVSQVATLLDARASTAFAAGRLREAHDAWRRWVEIMAVPGILPLAIRPALWERDVDLVRKDFATLEASGYHGPTADADRTTIRAGLAALDGRDGEAMRLYREALREWHDLGQPWREALTAIDMATLLDSKEPEVRAAAESAREILVRLEAAPFIARLDEALTRSSDRPIESAAPADRLRDAPVNTP